MTRDEIMAELTYGPHSQPPIFHCDDDRPLPSLTNLVFIFSNADETKGLLKLGDGRVYAVSGPFANMTTHTNFLFALKRWLRTEFKLVADALQIIRALNVVAKKLGDCRDPR